MFGVKSQLMGGSVGFWGYGLSVMGALCLSFFALLGKVGGGVLDTCPTEGCEVVQHSTFSELFGVPVAAYAFGLLIVVLVLWWMRSEKGLWFLSFLFGAELYLTAVEFFYLKGECPLCIAFLGLLGLSLILGLKCFPWKEAVAFGLFGFLGLHFLYFPLNFNPKGGVPFQREGEGVIAVYLRPGQEKEIMELVELARKREFEVLLFHIAPNPAERYKAIRQICQALSSEEKGLSLRVAERILRENEEKAKRYGLKTPFVVVRTNGSEEALDLKEALWRLEGFMPLSSPFH